MKTRWASVGIFLFALLSGLVMPAFGMVPGDINLDGVVSVSDVQCIVLAATSPGPDLPECLVSPEAGDLDCSGEINVADVQLMSGIALGHLNQIPGMPEGVDADRDNVHDECDINPDYFDPEQADRDTLATLWCGDGEVAKWNNEDAWWACAPDADTHLDEAAVDLMVGNNGYLTGEVDPKVGELTADKWCRAEGGKVVCNQLPPVDYDTFALLGCTNDQVPMWNTGTSWGCIHRDDLGTTLTESEVDDMVSNNGYLSAEEDPKVGELEEDKWCRAQGGKVVCEQEPTVPKTFTAQTEALQPGEVISLDTLDDSPELIAQAWYEDAGEWFAIHASKVKVGACVDCGSGDGGDWSATANTTMGGGTHEFESFTIANNVTVSADSSLVIRARKMIVIEGTLSMNISGSSGGSSDGADGEGEGGGSGANSSSGLGGGGGGYGTAGQPSGGGTAGGPVWGVSPLEELALGSGGGGSFSLSYFSNSAGGRGGGAVMLVAPIINIGGTIHARGGAGADGHAGGGGGSGGSIWLRAQQMDISGELSVAGGSGGTGKQQGGIWGSAGGAGGEGRIRLDAYGVTGNIETNYAMGETTGLEAKSDSGLILYQPSSGTVAVKNQTETPQKVRVVVIKP